MIQTEQQAPQSQERHAYPLLADYGSPQAPRPFSHRWWLLVANLADDRIGVSCHTYRAGQMSERMFDRHVAVATYCQRRWWHSLQADLRRAGHLNDGQVDAPC